MAEELSRAHGTVVIDADFSAYEVNARKAIETSKKVEAGAKKMEEAFNSIGRVASQQLAMVSKGADAAAASTNKANEATKRRTRLTMEERREIELLRRETNRLKEEQRVEASNKTQANIAANAALLEDTKRTNRQLEREAKERQRILRQLLGAAVPGGGTATGTPVAHNNLIGVPFSTFFQRYQNSQQRQMLMNRGNMTMSQALNFQIASAAQQSNQNYLLQNAIANAAPPVFGGGGPPGAGGGRGGRSGGLFGGNILGPGGLGARLISGLRGGLGAGLGVFGAVQAGRQAVEMSQLATAYDRQRVASERLAGSQAQLNALLEAYQRASGGAVDNVTALENVTRLQATGFAKSAEQVERFVRGTRGASIALGKPQDYLIQETQLAISNTSVKRLDQIGLGIEEVTDRTEQLRDANKSLTREGAFGEAILTLLNEKYGTLTDTLEGQATGLELLRKKWQDLRLEMGQNAQSPVNKTAGFLAGLIQNSLNNQGQRKLFREDAMNASTGFTGISLFDLWGALTGRTGTQVRAQNALDTGMFRHGPRGDGPEGNYVNPVITAAPRFGDEQMKSFSDFHARQQRIEEEYNQARLQETENYEQQRSSLIRNFAKQTAREEEDFFRQRARSARDYNKQVEDVMENAAKRDADLLEDYTERISDMREDSEEKIAEIQEAYAEDRERAEKDHLDRLMSAAGQLNAIAVLEERKRYRRENEEREKAHEKNLEDNREALAEAEADAKEAYEERLQEARESDQERLDDMREAREQQLADEDEDRAIRLARAQEDHDDQLDELDRQHELRLKQISDEAQKERDLWETEFEQLLLDMGIYVAGLTEKETARNKLIEDWFDGMIAKMEEELARINTDKETTSPFQYDPDSAGGPRLSYASGGAVRHSGLASLHQGEFVLSRGMLTGRVPVPASVAGAINNSRSSSIEIKEGAITITAVPGDSAPYLASLIEEQFIKMVEAS